MRSATRPGEIKTDNASLYSKIALRCWLLKRMGLSTLRVLDTCTGAGHVWSTMRQHAEITTWVRTDVKPRTDGTLKMTATAAVKTFPLHEFNVIDIDPYGEPWEPYLEMLPRLTTPTAVFLTQGHLGPTYASRRALAAAGIPPNWPVPRTRELLIYASRQVLARTWQYADIVHAASVSLPAVSYYALALHPRRTSPRRAARS